MSDFRWWQVLDGSWSWRTCYRGTETETEMETALPETDQGSPPGCNILYSRRQCSGHSRYDRSDPQPQGGAETHHRETYKLNWIDGRLWLKQAAHVLPFEVEIPFRFVRFPNLC